MVATGGCRSMCFLLSFCSPQNCSCLLERSLRITAFITEFFQVQCPALPNPLQGHKVGIWLRMSISLKFLQSNRAHMEPPCQALHFRRAHRPFHGSSSLNYLWIVVENLPSGACESGCFIKSIPSCSLWICVCQSSAFVDLNKKEHSICYKSKMEPLKK